MVKRGMRVMATVPEDRKTSIQYETGEVVYVGRRALVQFDRNICGHDGYGKGEKRRCWMVSFEKLKEIKTIKEGANGR